MKPGSRADREEMVRILVEDLKASVEDLDMHDYRKVVALPSRVTVLCAG